MILSITTIVRLFLSILKFGIDDAVRFGKKLGHSVEKLKTLRALNTINPFAEYRIDTSKLEFIELARTQKENAKWLTHYLLRTIKVQSEKGELHFSYCVTEKYGWTSTTQLDSSLLVKLLSCIELFSLYRY